MADKSDNTFNSEMEVLRREIKDLTSTVADLLRRETDNARSSMKGMTENIANKVSSAAHSVSEAGQHFASDAQDTIRTATTKVEDCIEEHPLQSVLIAVGIGFVIGLMSRR